MNRITKSKKLEPSAAIAVDKNLQKSKDGVVYLEDGTNFQIYLSNPKYTSILAMIYLNDNPIGDTGIVIRPGEKIWLDRWINVQRKLKFETYKVDNDTETLDAIKNNGKVEVKFYDENIPFIGYNTIISYPYYNPNKINFNNLNIPPVTCDVTGTQTVMYYSSSHTNNINETKTETGIVSIGDESKQDFEYSNQSFNSYVSSSIKYQLLPASRELKTMDDLKTYCTSCGLKKRNENWKFCPSCGNELV